MITFLDAILEKTLRSTVALTASRGRGKSAALGLAIAGAIAAGSVYVYETSEMKLIFMSISWVDMYYIMISLAGIQTFSSLHQVQKT